MLIWKCGQESLTKPREFWARGLVLPGQGHGSEFWGSLHSEQVSLHVFRAGGLPRLGC